MPLHNKDKNNEENSLGISNGELMYAMVCMQLDIAHTVRLESHFLSNPRKEQQALIKWIIRYT